MQVRRDESSRFEGRLGMESPSPMLMVVDCDELKRDSKLCLSVGIARLTFRLLSLLPFNANVPAPGGEEG